MSRAPGKLLIRGGHVSDPASGVVGTRDVLVDRGRIAAVADRIDADSRLEATLVDARGRWVVPGLIDMHVHFREPGFEEDETIETGSACALFGGFTTVACMANTRPPIDDPVRLARVVETARRSRIRILPVSAVTRGLLGEELVDFEAQARAGAIAFSDDGKPVFREDLLERALERAAPLHRPIIQHSEVPELFTGGCMHEGMVSRRLGVKGIPSRAEWAMIERDIGVLARLGSGVGHLHVAHVSTADSVERIRSAKARGLHVSAEVTPHHLTLTDRRLDDSDANFKMNPPLREEADMQALRAALADGTIDCVASDHAPHAPAKKARGLAQAPFGVIGLESTVPVILTHLVHAGHLSKEDFVRRLSLRPAEILGIEGGRLSPGDRADVTILDPEAPRTIRPHEMHSKSRNCPFFGDALRGRVEWVVAAGVLHDVRPRS